MVGARQDAERERLRSVEDPQGCVQDVHQFHPLLISFLRLADGIFLRVQLVINVKVRRRLAIEKTQENNKKIKITADQIQSSQAIFSVGVNPHSRACQQCFKLCVCVCVCVGWSPSSSWR